MVAERYCGPRRVLLLLQASQHLEQPDLSNLEETPPYSIQKSYHYYYRLHINTR